MEMMTVGQWTSEKDIKISLDSRVWRKDLLNLSSSLCKSLSILEMGGTSASREKEIDRWRRSFLYLISGGGAAFVWLSIDLLSISKATTWEEWPGSARGKLWPSSIVWFENRYLLNVLFDVFQRLLFYLPCYSMKIVLSLCKSVPTTTAIGVDLRHFCNNITGGLWLDMIGQYKTLESKGREIISIIIRLLKLALVSLFFDILLFMCIVRVPPPIRRSQGSERVMGQGTEGRWNL